MSDKATTEFDPWERQSNETTGAYAAFVAYRDLGAATRGMLKAWRLMAGKPTARTIPGKWTEWSRRYTWTERARVYDIYIEREQRKVREAEHSASLEAYRKRQRELSEGAQAAAMGLLLKASERLADLDASQIKPGMLPAFFRAAAHVAEVAGDAEATALGVTELAALLEREDEGTPHSR